MINFIGSSFIEGVMAQSPNAITLWDKVLRATQFRRIIELGTANGNFSLYLYLWCIGRGADFYTMDIMKSWHNGNRILKDKLDFESHFYNIDIFEKQEDIKTLIQGEGKTILICDNGNKIKEFKTFAPMLKAGDLISVHDWDTEISEVDTRGICSLMNLDFVFLAESKDEGWTRIFQKQA